MGLPEKKSNSFYAAVVPKTLSECLVKAAESDQGLVAEFQLLRGMLSELLGNISASERAANKDERDEIREFAKDIRATAKVISEMTLKERGMLHPSALGIFANMIIQIVKQVLPDEKQQTIVQQELQNRIALLPIKDMQRG